MHKFVVYSGNNPQSIREALLRRGNWEEVKPSHWKNRVYWLNTEIISKRYQKMIKMPGAMHIWYGDQQIFQLMSYYCSYSGLKNEILGLSKVWWCSEEISKKFNPSDKKNSGSKLLKLTTLGIQPFWEQPWYMHQNRVNTNIKSVLSCEWRSQ